LHEKRERPKEKASGEGEATYQCRKDKRDLAAPLKKLEDCCGFLFGMAASKKQGEGRKIGGVGARVRKRQRKGPITKEGG